MKIYKGGEVSIGDDVIIASQTKLLCENSIVIKDVVRIIHECQVMDSNFHYIYDIENDKVEPCNGKVEIGTNNWIANRCTIQKGTTTPDFCIVASNSILSKDYKSELPQNCLIGGAPARIIKSGLRRIFDFEEEEKWNKTYNRIKH